MILIFFQLLNLLSLFVGLRFEFIHFLILYFLEHGLLFLLESLMHFKVLNEVLVSLEDAVENALLLLTARVDLGSRIPAHRILSLWIHSAIEWNWSCWLGPPLQAELVGPVAKHDSLEAPDGSLGHLSLASIAGDARTRVVDSVRHF